MKNRMIAGAVIALIVLLAAAATIILPLRTSPPVVQANPYEYNIDEFKAVRPDLVKYTEAQEIKLVVKEPQGLAVGKDDTIYVCGSDAIEVFSPNGKARRSTQIEEGGHCLAVDEEGRIYLGATNHVLVLDAKGSLIESWESLGEKAFITSIAVSSNNVFVADYGSSMVWRFDRAGRMLGMIGQKTTEPQFGGFILPSRNFDVVAAADGSAWIVNPGMQLVTHFSPEGRYLSAWGSSGMAIDKFCGCCNPSHIAMAADGRMVTSEKGMPRVKVYDREGRLESVVAAPSAFSEEAVGLDLAVDSAGRILVLDPSRKSVRIFVDGNE